MLVVKNPSINVGGMRHRFDSWFRKIAWKRPWEPIPGFLPGEFHGQRSLAGYSPWGHKESDTTEQHTHTHTHTRSNENIYLAFIFCQALLNFCVISTFLICVFLSLWSTDLEGQDQKILCFEVWANCFFKSWVNTQIQRTNYCLPGGRGKRGGAR